MTNKELEDRLIRFTVMIIKLIKNLPEDRVTNHLSGQLIRSSSSPSLNYGEALAAESKKDFVHKLGIVLKELRETYNCIRVLVGAGYLPESNSALKECNELISIFVKSVETSKRNSDLGSTKS